MGIIDNLMGSPFLVLDVITGVIMIVSYAGLLVAFAFKLHENLKYFWLSMVIALAPAITLTLFLSPFYNEITLFLIYYPCFMLILYSLLPRIRGFFSDIDTQPDTHTDTDTHTDIEQDTEEPEET